MKAIVLGGGVIGTATAYYLAKFGHEVHLVERQSGVAMETSFANGGVLHTSEAEPWSRPGMPAKTLKWLGKENPPMLLRYRALPGMSGTPPMVAAGPAPQARARDGSPEFTWRETGFNVMRWTSAALALLAVVGVVIVLVMPGLRRRLFFPDMQQMPPRPLATVSE